MAGIVKNIGGKALLINGMPDHVHLLVSLPATLSITDAVRLIKTNSSRWVHQTWQTRRSFAWQTGYGAFSVSLSNKDAVYKYIAKQEWHHRKKSFQEEFLDFLKKHGIEYDERYVWD